MRSFDFAPLLRSSIGFENLNRLVDFATRGEGDAYPPYNIEKVGEDAYRISMATAGFDATIAARSCRSAIWRRTFAETSASIAR